MLKSAVSESVWCRGLWTRLMAEVDAFLFCNVLPGGYDSPHQRVCKFKITAKVEIKTAGLSLIHSVVQSPAECFLLMADKTVKRNSVSRQPSRSVLQRIRLFATDVDGVLTDAGMYYAESGDEWKKFNTRDGMGIKLLQRAGFITAIVTQERTKIVARRGEKLAIPEVHQGVMDKLSLIREMAGRHGLSLSQVAYIGDDINDLESLRAVGFSASPADGMPEICRTVDYVCRKKGGEGAVREVVELILDAQQRRSR